MAMECQTIRTYFGSQWAIVKLKLIRVTNMSVSKRISCTDGGGKAIASATIPSSGAGVFRECENVYCGRSLHSIRTTCNDNDKDEENKENMKFIRIEPSKSIKSIKWQWQCVGTNSKVIIFAVVADDSVITFTTQ